MIIFCKKNLNSFSRGQKNGTAKTQEKTELSKKYPLNLLKAALRAVVKLYNQKFDNFSLKSELKAERVPVKPLKRFLWTRRRQFWQPRGKTFDKSMKKKHEFRLSSKIEGFCHNVSVDTLNAATTNSMEFFSRKSDKSSQDYRTYLTTIRLLKTIAFLKNLLRTNGIRFWQPCLFGQRTGNFLLTARKNFAEVLDRRFNHFWMFFKRNPVFLNKFRRKHGLQFQQPCQWIFVKMQKKSPRVRRKWKNYKTPEKTEFSTNDPLNLLNAVLRAVAKLYKQKFDFFSLMSGLKAEIVPVKPLKSFLWTRRRQFCQPRGKTIKKIPKKKYVVISLK